MGVEVIQGSSCSSSKSIRLLVKMGIAMSMPATGLNTIIFTNLFKELNMKVDINTVDAFEGRKNEVNIISLSPSRGWIS